MVLIFAMKFHPAVRVFSFVCIVCVFVCVWCEREWRLKEIGFRILGPERHIAHYTKQWSTIDKAVKCAWNHTFTKPHLKRSMMIEQIESFRQEQCKKGIEVSFMLQFQQFGNQIFLGKIAGNKNGRYHKYRVCKKQQSANFSCPSLRDGSLSLLFVFSLSHSVLSHQSRWSLGTYSVCRWCLFKNYIDLSCLNKDVKWDLNVKIIPKNLWYFYERIMTIWSRN